MSARTELTLSVSEAFERLDGDPAATVLLTCEHASQRLPEGWSWPEADARLVDTHWAFDLGARDVVLELAQALSAPAVLSRFTRLLVDPNREPDHVDLFRKHAEGEAVALNHGLTDSEAEQRVKRYYEPYHAAVHAAAHGHPAPILLSVHSFTPVYEGTARSVELGVLFNDDEQLAGELLEHLSGRLPNVAANEPWSGKEGLIHAVERHARHHGRRAVELEVRQDLAQEPAYRRRLVQAVREFFSTR